MLFVTVLSWPENLQTRSMDTKLRGAKREMEKPMMRISILNKENAKE